MVASGIVADQYHKDDVSLHILNFFKHFMISIGNKLFMKSYDFSSQVSGVNPVVVITVNALIVQKVKRVSFT